MKIARYLVLILLAAGIILFYKNGLPISDKTASKQILESTSTGVGRIQGEFPVVTPTYSLEDISEHNTEDGCWIVVNSKVYDVTEYIASHPGGDSVLEGCGTDATELYETRPMGSGTPHSNRARDLLEAYYIGELEPEAMDSPAKVEETAPETF